jgi:DNA-binding SARP family transcriptional activator
MAAEVGIGILGPLEVAVGPGAAVDIPGQRLPALLTRLAIDPGRVVASAQLVEAVWQDDPPAGAANALQSLVSRLRRLLPGLVDSSPAGYRLAVEPEAVDATRFEALARAGRAELAAGRPADAATTLRRALALWRGPALASVTKTTAGFAAPAARLEELRLATLEDRVDADLAGGGAALTDLVAELDELATAHPHRERLCGLRMLALARAGRPADALDAYERLRAELPTSSASTLARPSRPCTCASCAARSPARPPPPRPRHEPARPSRPGPTCAPRSPASSAATATWPGSRRRSTPTAWSR